MLYDKQYGLVLGWYVCIQARGVGLARALLRETPILLLDEPTNDLDPDRQQVSERGDVVMYVCTSARCCIVWCVVSNV